MAMTEGPTKTFTFECTRPVEQRQPRANPLRAMTVQRNLAYTHLPPPRMRGAMTGKDELYNDIRSYLEVKVVGFDVDSASFLGDEFVKHLSYALFPLSEKVWIANNEKHNRGGAAPDPEFGVFFGRKFLGHKLHKPDLAVTV